MGVLSKNEADGELSVSNASLVSGTPDNSVFSWKRGRVEYQFIATSTTPLPAEPTEY